jgi:hypothetical protein
LIEALGIAELAAGEPAVEESASSGTEEASVVPSGRHASSE